MFTDLSHGFYYSCLVVAALIGVVSYHKVDRVFQILCLLIIFTLPCELVARYFSLHRMHNAIIYLIFTPFEYAMYASIYQMFFNDKKWKKILNISVLFLIFFEITNILFLSNLNDVANHLFNLECVLLVFLSLQLFLRIMQNPVFKNILYEGVFWFNSAILFYYSLNILIWGFHGVVYQSNDPPVIIYTFLRFFSTLLYIIYATAIILNFSSVKQVTLKVNELSASNKPS